MSLSRRCRGDVCRVGACWRRETLTSSVPETFEYFLASSQILQLREVSNWFNITPVHKATRPPAHWRALPAFTCTGKASEPHPLTSAKVKTKRATAAPLGPRFRSAAHQRGRRAQPGAARPSAVRCNVGRCLHSHPIAQRKRNRYRPIAASASRRTVSAHIFLDNMPEESPADQCVEPLT